MPEGESIVSVLVLTVVLAAAHGHLDFHGGVQSCSVKIWIIFSFITRKLIIFWSELTY